MRSAGPNEKTPVPRLPATAGTQRVAVLDVMGARALLGSFPGGLRMMPHVHERACVTFVLEGRFVERVGGRDRDCQPGTVLVKPGLERHDDHFSAAGSRQIILEPDESAVELLEPCRTLLASVSHGQDSELERLARRLALEIEHPDEISPLASAALTWELLASVTRRRKLARSARRPPLWLARVRDRLNEERGVPALDALAREAGVHPVYLARLFREHYGCPIGVFLRRRRLQAAALELSAANTPITHIALMNGFADQSHFTRQFRRYYGLTPYDYRKRHRSP